MKIFIQMKHLNTEVEVAADLEIGVDKAGHMIYVHTYTYKLCCCESEG